MEDDSIPPPSLAKFPLVLACFGLGLLQQIIGFGMTAVTEQAAQAGGGPVFAHPPWPVAVVFIVLCSVLNGVFYSATWLNCLDAPLLRARLKSLYLVGAVAAAVFFLLGGLISNQLSQAAPGTPGVTFAAPVAAPAPAQPIRLNGWAQVVVLVCTLAAAFRLEDTRPVLHSIRAASRPPPSAGR